MGSCKGRGEWGKVSVGSLLRVAVVSLLEFVYWSGRRSLR